MTTPSTPRAKSLAAAAFLALAAAACSDNTATSAKALAIAAGNPALSWSACPPVFSEGCTIAVLHGDPAKPNADVFLRVPAKYAIPAHWHTSPERMVLVTGRLEVTYKGQPAATLEPGTYAYGPAKLPHHATCQSDDACTLFIAFEGAVDTHAGGME
jgi:quercetin dioxygenase-like cupin family protein